MRMRSTNWDKIDRPERLVRRRAAFKLQCIRNYHLYGFEIRAELNRSYRINAIRSKSKVFSETISPRTKTDHNNLLRRISVSLLQCELHA